MAGDGGLPAFLGSIASGGAAARVAADPSIAHARLARADEAFVPEIGVQVYEDDTALHAAAAAHDPDLVRLLVAAGADVSARNRRGAEPLHAAVSGGPGSDRWDPVAQQRVIELLVAAGAAVDARASGGVTPLHRAIRNRCSLAVRTLLDLGADATLTNDRGTTASTLAQQATGRGGTGSVAAKREQAEILRMLEV